MPNMIKNDGMEFLNTLNEFIQTASGWYLNYVRPPSTTKKVPIILDDGTLDTVVLYNDVVHRYSSEYRFSFENDEEFLDGVQEELENDEGIDND